MTGIIAVALQLLLLLLRAHFNRDDDHEKAMQSIREAQSKLEELATAFETKIRYSAPPQAHVDRLENEMDEERKNHETH